MNRSERRYLIIGIASTLIVLVFLYLTKVFSYFFIKYSGVLTFYSLLAVFVIFGLTEYYKRRERRQGELDELKNILRASKQIGKDLTYYKEILSQGSIPPTTMGEFELGLPPEINSISTNKLNDLMIFADSKIEIINEWKDGYLERLLEPDKKERDKLIVHFRAVWSNNLDIAINELTKTLDEIKKELSNWIKFEE